MEFIKSTYSLLHHSSQLPPSLLDMLLLSIKSIVSVIGTLVILTGVGVSAYRFVLMRVIPSPGIDINIIRRDLGLCIVLGLEFIIAADVIETTTTPDYYSLGILGAIVLIRTFLSLSLSREISDLSKNQKESLKLE